MLHTKFRGNRLAGSEKIFKGFLPLYLWAKVKKLLKNKCRKTKNEKQTNF